MGLKRLLKPHRDPHSPLSVRHFAVRRARLTLVCEKQMRFTIVCTAVFPHAANSTISLIYYYYFRFNVQIGNPVRSY